jgi:hypothetical protein
MANRWNTAAVEEQETMDMMDNTISRSDKGIGLSLPGQIVLVLQGGGKRETILLLRMHIWKMGAAIQVCQNGLGFVLEARLVGTRLLQTAWKRHDSD